MLYTYYAEYDEKFASMINCPIMKRAVVNFIMFMISNYLKCSVLEFISVALSKSLKFK